MLEFTKLAPQSKATYYCFPSIMEEKRVTVGTAVAAHWLNRSPQTLRLWHCTGTGALQPLVINGRLAWSVKKLRNILCEGAEA